MRSDRAYEAKETTEDRSTFQSYQVNRRLKTSQIHHAPSPTSNKWFIVNCFSPGFPFQTARLSDKTNATVKKKDKAPNKSQTSDLILFPATHKWRLWFWHVLQSCRCSRSGEKRSINPQKNMFAGKQNVIELILCCVFDLEQKRQRCSHLFLVTPMD